MCFQRRKKGTIRKSSGTALLLASVLQGFSRLLSTPPFTLFMGRELAEEELLEHGVGHASANAD